MMERGTQGDGEKGKQSGSLMHRPRRSGHGSSLHLPENAGKLALGGQEGVFRRQSGRLGRGKRREKKRGGGLIGGRWSRLAESTDPKHKNKILETVSASTWEDNRRAPRRRHAKRSKIVSGATAGEGTSRHTRRTLGSLWEWRKVKMINRVGRYPRPDEGVRNKESRVSENLAGEEKKALFKEEKKAHIRGLGG